MVIGWAIDEHVRSDMVESALTVAGGSWLLPTVEP